MDKSISLINLSLLFSRPSIVNEFVPKSLWVGQESVDISKNFVPSFKGGSISSIKLAFEKVLTSKLKSHKVIGIAYSGGLDSLAIIKVVDSICKSLGKKLIAITANLHNDLDEKISEKAISILKHLKVECKHITIDPKSISFNDSLYWNVDRPRMEALPHLAQRIMQEAINNGATILLSGNGADGLVTCPKFMLLDYFKASLYSNAIQYLKDISRSGLWTFKRESLSLFSHLLNEKNKVKLYWASNNSELSFPDEHYHLKPYYRRNSTIFYKNFVKKNLEDLIKLNKLWSEMEIIDFLSHNQLLLPTGEIETYSPFEDNDFITEAIKLPTYLRYNGKLASPYLRQKSLLVDIIGIQYQNILPQKKETFRDFIMKNDVQSRVQPEILVEKGILDGDYIKKLNTDDVYESNLVARITVVELWLRQALERGYSLK